MRGWVLARVERRSKGRAVRGWVLARVERRVRCRSSPSPTGECKVDEGHGCLRRGAVIHAPRGLDGADACQVYSSGFRV